ncbi:MAG: hypothetical protein ACLUHE_04895 [Christensenellales bacterium]
MKNHIRAFRNYALIIIGVLIAAQLSFSPSFSSQRGQRIEAAKLFEMAIQSSGVIDAVAPGGRCGLMRT